MGAFGPRSSVGLDLGSHTLKVAELVRAGDSVRIERVGTMPTPPGAVSKGVAVDADALAPTLRTLFQDAGIGSTRIATALGGQAAVIREVTVPAMPDADLAQAVAFEAERYLPPGAGEVRCEYRVVDRTSENGQLELLLVATEKGLIDRQLAPLAMAGLTSDLMEVTPFSMARAVSPDPGHNGHPMMYVDLGAEGTDVLIVDEGRVRLARAIPIGGDALTRAIADALGLDTFAAEMLKVERGRLVLEGEQPGESRAGEVHRAILPVVERLTAELRRSLDFYRARLHGRPLSTVVLTGGTAKLGNVAPYLGAALGLRVEMGDPFRACDVGAGVPATSRADIAPVMAVAVGLALRGARA